MIYGSFCKIRGMSEKLKDIKDIIEAEGLKDYNLGLEHKVKAGEIIIAREDGKWRVSIANDRAEIVSTSIREFDSEDEAADDFLTRLRGLNRIKAARQKTFGRNDSMV